METTDAIAAFSALAQDTRLAVFRLLVQAGPDGMLAGEISAALDVRPNTLSANLAILLNAGLVLNTREGRMVRYTADLEGLRSLLRFIMQDCCGGRPELCQPVIDAVACDC
ncbi:MAG: helix-turn-helix transcriptional regulator [Rhodobacteraceae bacterium]|nr:helix-turn-helix transcriptional regulator [Paracoccaceae bacterium]